MNMGSKHTPMDRNPEDWRITIGNINSFPTDSKGHNGHKVDILKKLVVQNGSDIVMISEHNLSHNAQPNNIVKKLWPRTIIG